MSPAPAPTASPAPIASPIGSIPAGSPAITGAQVCADLAAFQASLDELTGLTSGSAAIRDVLGAVEATVTTGQAFVESAKATFGPEAQALGTALAGLQTALQGISGDGSLGDKAATVENAIDEVAAAFDALKAKVEPGCPAPEASGS
jgi:predicted trehalose synthase